MRSSNSGKNYRLKSERPRYSLVIFTTWSDSSVMEIRFGMAIKPLKVSERFQTKDRCRMEPKNIK